MSLFPNLYVHSQTADLPDLFHVAVLKGDASEGPVSLRTHAVDTDGSTERGIPEGAFFSTVRCLYLFGLATCDEFIGNASLGVLGVGVGDS